MLLLILDLMHAMNLRSSTRQVFSAKFFNGNVCMRPCLMLASHPRSVAVPTTNPRIRLRQKFKRLVGAPNTNGLCTKWRIKADNDAIPEENTAVEETRQSSVTRQPSSGRGFGSSSVKKGKSRTRIPPEKVQLLPQGDLPEIEIAFLVSWSGLGILVLVEGILLDSSGLLPEGWDNFVKDLEPTFTPTVLVFVIGASAYGLYKYFQRGQQKS